MVQADKSTSDDKPRGRRPTARHAIAILSILPCAALSFIYWFRPDSFAAITVWPAWIWALAGLFPLLFCIRRKNNRLIAAAAAVWLVYLAVLAEEPRSLLRFNRFDSQEWSGARTARRLRVVSLNCAGGSVEAMREVAAYKPDIVLLQESPPSKDVEAFARALYGTEGEALPGLDASLIAHGRLVPAALPRTDSAYFVQARVKLMNGLDIEVISARLMPAVFREDLWSPDCWRVHTENRRARREQLRAVADRVAKLPSGMPVLVGGDFNAPQDDAIFDLFRPHLSDSFKIGGSGWGNTIINEIPALRIDQIWTSAQLRPVAVVARRTINSDHRMVIAEFIAETAAGK